MVNQFIFTLNFVIWRDGFHLKLRVIKLLWVVILPPGFSQSRFQTRKNNDVNRCHKIVRLQSL